jgi:hypothetical protein
MIMHPARRGWRPGEPGPGHRLPGAADPIRHQAWRAIVSRVAFDRLDRCEKAAEAAEEFAVARRIALFLLHDVVDIRPRSASNPSATNTQHRIVVRSRLSDDHAAVAGWPRRRRRPAGEFGECPAEREHSDALSGQVILPRNWLFRNQRRPGRSRRGPPVPARWQPDGEPTVRNSGSRLRARVSRRRPSRWITDEGRGGAGVLGDAADGRSPSTTASKTLGEYVGADRRGQCTRFAPSPTVKCELQTPS